MDLITREKGKKLPPPIRLYPRYCRFSALSESWELERKVRVRVGNEREAKAGADGKEKIEREKSRKKAGEDDTVISQLSYREVSYCLPILRNYTYTAA